MRSILIFLFLLIFTSCKKDVNIDLNNEIVHVDNYYMPRCEKNLGVKYNLSYSIENIKDTISVYNSNASDTMIIRFKNKDHIYITDKKIYDLYKPGDYIISKNDTLWFIKIIN
jgi:hypothetical protein